MAKTYQELLEEEIYAYVGPYDEDEPDSTADPLLNRGGTLSEEERLRLILIRQARDIQKIRGYVKFFFVLAVISLVLGALLFILASM